MRQTMDNDKESYIFTYSIDLACLDSLKSRGIVISIIGRSGQRGPDGAVLDSEDKLGSKNSVTHIGEKGCGCKETRYLQ